MPNRLGPNRLGPSFSTVWQIAHCRTKAALPLAASPAARLGFGGASSAAAATAAMALRPLPRRPCAIAREDGRKRPFEPAKTGVNALLSRDPYFVASRPGTAAPSVAMAFLQMQTSAQADTIVVICCIHHVKAANRRVRP